jgi:hypothetical protein
MLIRIDYAYCVELEKVVTADEARREFLSLETPIERFNFLCSEEACRAAKVQIIGVAYRTAAQEQEKFVAAHFRRKASDSHLEGCLWNTLENEDIDPSRKAPDDAARRRQAHRKLTDFVNVFDPRLDADAAGGSLSTPDTSIVHPNTVGESKKRRGSVTDHRPGKTRTNSLGRLVDTYLEAQGKLTREEFSALRIHIAGLGTIPIRDYFCPIRRAALTNNGRVLFGGAILVKRYSQGFKLRFYDRVDQLSVFLYVSPDMMAAYRYRKYLAHVIEQADAVGHHSRSESRYSTLQGRQSEGFQQHRDQVEGIHGIADPRIAVPEFRAFEWNLDVVAFQDGQIDLPGLARDVKSHAGGVAGPVRPALNRRVTAYGATHGFAEPGNAPCPEWVETWVPRGSDLEQ